MILLVILHLNIIRKMVIDPVITYNQYFIFLLRLLLSLTFSDNFLISFFPFCTFSIVFRTRWMKTHLLQRIILLDFLYVRRYFRINYPTVSSTISSWFYIFLCKRIQFHQRLGNSRICNLRVRVSHQIRTIFSVVLN